MKVLFLADPVSIHTVRWVNALTEENVEVSLFGLNKFDESLFKKKIIFESANITANVKNKPDASFSKAVYLASLLKIKKFINRVKPDIVHAHYISSYGLLGSLTEFHPYIISVWGSDIFYVPQKGWLQKKLIKYSLKKADKILSTSNFMAEQIRGYTHKPVITTPFGIDVNVFKPVQQDSFFMPGDIVVGTTKALEEKYGNEYLIRAFRLVKNRLPSVSLKLLIVGGGSQENYLKHLVEELKLDNDTIFTGIVPHNEIQKYYNVMDIYAALSTENESFGVSVLESMACETPVVVSDVGGFTELVLNEETGLITARKSTADIAEAILKLITDNKLREKLGRNGRDLVLSKYKWEESVRLMLQIYRQTLDDSRKPEYS